MPELTGGSIIDLAVPFALLLAADAMKKKKRETKGKEQRGGSHDCPLCKNRNTR
jgi:hypothetical protein